MRVLILLLLAGLAPGAHAQAVYKCRDHKGQPVYQSFPCGGTKPPEKVWSGQYRQPTNAELWQRYNLDQERRARQREQAQRRHYYTSSQSDNSTSAARRGACAAARSEYNRVQADFTLNRNIDLLRRLEASIRNHCEVRP